MHAMQIAVAGGRELEVVMLGSPEGRPVLYFHGAGGTPLRSCPEALAAVDRAGVRLLCLSRPGFGGSCPQPGRRLADHPADVARVADALGLERFALLGVSAGGAHAAACVRALGPRVVATALSACCVPAGCASLRAAAAAASVAGYGHAARGAGGLRNVLHDARLAMRPWGFAPEEVGGEVHWWHGERDPFVALADARAVAARMPDCHLTVLVGEGHFFLRRRLGDMLAGLMGAWDARLVAPSRARLSPSPPRRTSPRGPRRRRGAAAPRTTSTRRRW